MENRPLKLANELCRKFNTRQNILVCGVGFKPLQKITVNSANIKFAEELSKNHNIMYYDPVIQDINIGDIKKCELQDGIPQFSLFDYTCVMYELDHFPQPVVDAFPKKNISFYSKV